MNQAQTGSVWLHSEGPIWTLELDRPEKLNAVSPAMADELYAAESAQFGAPEINYESAVEN